MPPTPHPLATIVEPIRSYPRLAVEIQDMIIDYLHESVQDLRICSLVSHSWLRQSRSHLFGEVKYRPRFFRMLFDSLHENVVHSIRKIRLSGSYYQSAEKADVLSHILRLPNLKVLEVEKLDWAGLNTLFDSSTSFHKHSDSQLSHLQLHSVRFPTFSTLVQLLGQPAFNSLEKLSMDSVSWEELGTISIQDVLLFSKLRKLSISSCHSNKVLLNLLHYGVISASAEIQRSEDSAYSSTTDSTPSTSHHPFLPHFQEAKISDIHPMDISLLNAFLASLGDDLHKLDLGVSNTHEACSFPTPSLAYNSNLKSLTFHQLTLFQFPFHEPTRIPNDSAGGYSLSPRVTSSYHWIIQVLETIPHDVSLRSIAFKIWFSAEKQLDSINWSELDRILLKLRVAVVHFEISGLASDPDLTKSWIKARLPGIEYSQLQFLFAT